MVWARVLIRVWVRVLVRVWARACLNLVLPQYSARTIKVLQLKSIGHRDINFDKILISS